MSRARKLASAVALLIVSFVVTPLAAQTTPAAGTQAAPAAAAQATSTFTPGQPSILRTGNAVPATGATGSGANAGAARTSGVRTPTTALPA
ncbi:MAG: hypothetical protein WCQ50_11340, partial [Spirochaetota bacterium]